LKLQHNAKDALCEKGCSRFDSLRDDILSLSDDEIRSSDQTELIVKLINILEALAHDAKQRGK
tara:strand:- start:70 stop:258 length:189 start_codon:yes stop_codon:yes gene_type:complete